MNETQYEQQEFGTEIYLYLTGPMICEDNKSVSSFMDAERY